MATIHALPLSFPNYAGFENLVKPTWDAVGLTVNRQKLTELVEHAAELARKIITDEMAKKMITLEIDSASRRNRHVFGIYATYFSDKKGGPVSRCLAVKEMVKSQTADHLKDTMQTEAMGRYKMLSGQLYVVIADNGPNMQASIRQLGSMLLRNPDRENADSANQSSSSTLMAAETRAVDAVLQTVTEARLEQMLDMEDSEPEEEAEDTDVDESWEEETSEESSPGEFEFKGTRCAAHTSQLAVWDVLKSHTKRIEAIKSLVKKTRLVKYKQAFMENNTFYAPICNATRWNAVYLMMKSLKDQRTNYRILEDSFNELCFSKHWRFIDSACEALGPVFYLSVELQHEHVPLSEFYALWIACQAELNKLKDNQMAVKLHVAMNTRLKTLTDTMQFKAAIYFDPRFNYLGANRLKPKEKEAVQRYLLKLYDRMNELEGVELEVVESTENCDFVEEYLDELFDGDEDPIPAPGPNNHILQRIKELEFQKRVFVQPLLCKKPRFDIMKYWTAKKVSNSEMFRLAKVVLSTGSTQVNVERCFSALKLVVTDLRQKLSDPHVQDLMVLKLNPDLLPAIVQMMSDEM
ncbi:predicted protein [Culex quinquefasciatus]|uniref:Predicted protein n=1 Tax=Culex quinquefasciatus TaxID=7176 RepID=B0WN39_CULQU|nr:uncharacterized protein LOC6040778 [Culex quinquefasciatus]EDS31458.1 predicted protein [Culex quinquefasciatus]|eukprot:XP_001850123.1 predicted protein [Culex quinquefasciatus]